MAVRYIFCLHASQKRPTYNKCLSNYQVPESPTIIFPSVFNLVGGSAWQAISIGTQGQLSTQGTEALAALLSPEAWEKATGMAL